jgi:3-deoxy-D-arabino-heptulosonate 7-phosphate (DAHP) synthase class II
MRFTERLRALPTLQKAVKNYTRIIVMSSDPMGDNEITHALQHIDATDGYRALIQLIDVLRTEYPVSAALCAGSNNALGMARDVGAHEALTQLLLELEKRRTR